MNDATRKVLRLAAWPVRYALDHMDGATIVLTYIACAALVAAGMLIRGWMR
jgi:hypothetical protein